MYLENEEFDNIRSLIKNLLEDELIKLMSFLLLADKSGFLEFREFNKISPNFIYETIKISQLKIKRLLKRIHWLNSFCEENIQELFQDARLEAVKFSGFNPAVFHTECPFTIENIFDDYS